MQTRRTQTTLDQFLWINSIQLLVTNCGNQYTVYLLGLWQIMDYQTLQKYSPVYVQLLQASLS